MTVQPFEKSQNGLDNSHTRKLLLVGTCFGSETEPADSILCLGLDTVNGSLSRSYNNPGSSELQKVKTGTLLNPGWLSRIHSGRVFVAHENCPGSVQAYCINHALEDGLLVGDGNSSSDTKGAHPCYCQLDRSCRWLLVANYTSGSVSVLPVAAVKAGRCPLKVTTVKHSEVVAERWKQVCEYRNSDGSDLTDRQEGPHAHCILQHPLLPQWVVACDLGLSSVLVYRFDEESGSLSFHASWQHPDPAAGCRHACWHQVGRVLFVTNEMEGTVTSLSFDDNAGILCHLQTISTIPPPGSIGGGGGPTRAHHRGNSDVCVDPSGSWLFVGVRSTPKSGCICVLEIAGEISSAQHLVTLRVKGHTSTRGEVPRNFKLFTRSGSRGFPDKLNQEEVWLVVGNQESKTVVSLGFDHKTGTLAFASQVDTSPWKPCNIAGQQALFA